MKTTCSGISYRADKCSICTHAFEEQRSVHGYFATSGKQDKIVVMDCCVENEPNHAYHRACLKTFIEDELLRDKKTSSKDALES